AGARGRRWRRPAGVPRLRTLACILPAQRWAISAQGTVSFGLRGGTLLIPQVPVPPGSRHVEPGPSQESKSVPCPSQELFPIRHGVCLLVETRGNLDVGNRLCPTRIAHPPRRELIPWSERSNRTF